MKTLGAAVIVWYFALGMIVTHAEPTVNQFLKDYESAAPNRRALLEHTVSSVENGIGWANSFLRHVEKQRPIYCPPDDVALTGRQLLDMMRVAAKEGTNMNEMNLGLGVLETLRAGSGILDSAISGVSA